MKEKSPAFLFYPADFLNDPNVKFMSLDAKGAYMMLICHAWREQYIPNDLGKLAKLCECSEETIKAIWPSLKDCFTASKKENFLMHPRLEKERKKLKKSSELKTEKAKNAARARWSKAKRCDATSIACALPGDAISISSSISSDPPLTPPGGQSDWEKGKESPRPSANVLASEFQAVLRTQGKNVFGEKWFAQGVKSFEELLTLKKTPEDIRECMHWLTVEAECSPFINHPKQIIRYWNTWLGHKTGKVEKKEYWQRILAADSVEIDGPDGLLTVSGRELDYDGQAKQFIFRGQGYDVCYVRLPGRVA